MKKLVFISLVGCALMCASCSPKWLLINSSGVATYNRHTGQVEILWENKSAQVEQVHDTVYVCPEEKK